jgi:hypothetical protein
VAVPLLFTGWGAGQFGLVATTPTVNLSGNVTSATSNIQDGVIAVGAGVDLALSGGTVTGAIDFADATTKNTGGSCVMDLGGVCKVNAASAFTGGSVTGVTLQYNAAVTNAVNEWNGLVAASAWGSATGATAVNLGSGGPFVLCAGSGHSGCTTTNSTTTTRTVNGQTQTAYLFDISSSTGGNIANNITIKGDGNTLIVLLYNGASTLNISKSVTLADGVTSDQVLLNVTSAAGITTAAGFNFTGSLAVKDTTETLSGAIINGRLFLGGSGSATLNTSGSTGFSLTAAADIATPEPATEFLIGGAMVLVAVLVKRARK